MRIMRIGGGLAVSAIALLTGCGGSSGPVFDYSVATPPLEYELTRTSTTVVETPNGESGSDQAMNATLMLAFGAPVEGGREVTVTFTSLDLIVGGPMGEQSFGGDGVTGRPFAGVLHADGTISVTEAPEIEGQLADLFDPSGVVRDLLAPLPPDGSAAATSWVHSYTTEQSTIMDFESTYDGIAAFAGDSTFNGHATQVIVSTGDLEISAIGTPPGAPGEVEMSLAGPSETTYLWDSAAGVMRASASTLETEGEVMTMGFTLPVVTMVEATVVLKENGG